MFSAILYFILGTIRVMAGTVVGFIGTALLVKGEGSLILNILGYLGFTAIGLLLVAWGALYFRVAHDRVIPRWLFSFLAVLSMTYIVGLPCVFLTSSPPEGYSTGLAVVLFSPILAGIGWTVWTLVQTLRQEWQSPQ